MRDFSVDLVWTKVQIAITAIGGWVGYFVGGMDGMLIALIVLMSLDYISGVMCAIVDGQDRPHQRRQLLYPHRAEHRRKNPECGPPGRHIALWRAGL